MQILENECLETRANQTCGVHLQLNVTKRTCARVMRESTGNENTGYRISRALCLAFLNICFPWISLTLKP